VGLLDYHISKRLHAKDIPFTALVMAAMRKADTSNLERLIQAFPELYEELTERYNAPLGVIDRDNVEVSTEDLIERITMVIEELGL